MNTSLTFFFLGLNWNSLRVHILHHLQMGSMQLKHCLTVVWNRDLISGFRSLANSCKYLADVSVNFRSMSDRCASQSVASIVGWPFPSAPMKKKYDLFTFVSHFLCSKNKCLLKYLCTFFFLAFLPGREWNANSQNIFWGSAGFSELKGKIK